jgi:hypothetical protein
MQQSYETKTLALFDGRKPTCVTVEYHPTYTDKFVHCEMAENACFRPDVMRVQVWRDWIHVQPLR